MANYKETPIETGEDLTGFAELDEDAYPVWTCTNRLRWKRTKVNVANAMIETSILQQLWECSTGATEWREVDFVN